MKFFREKDALDTETDYRESDGSDQNRATTADYDDDLLVQCPPHTTEAKLIRKIDFKVIPFLCIMYRMPCACVAHWVPLTTNKSLHS